MTRKPVQRSYLTSRRTIQRTSLKYALDLFSSCTLEVKYLVILLKDTLLGGYLELLLFVFLLFLIIFISCFLLSLITFISCFFFTVSDLQLCLEFLVQIKFNTGALESFMQDIWKRPRLYFILNLSKHLCLVRLIFLVLGGTPCAFHPFVLPSVRPFACPLNCLSVCYQQKLSNVTSKNHKFCYSMWIYFLFLFFENFYLAF